MSRALRVFVLVSCVLIPATVFGGTGSVDVQVTIDGLSDLRLSGNTAQWHHLNWSPPGTTTINGVDWTPSGLSSFCNCVSDVFTGVSPRIPSNATGFALLVNDGRGTVTIEETPSPGNGWVLRVRFDDDGPGGADDYDVTITYVTPDPIPALSGEMLALLAMLLAVGGAWLLRR